jgi:hypothetical protein
MKLHEQLKVINKYTSVVIECRYKSKTEYYDGRVEAEEWIKTLHDGVLHDMDFEKFFDAMYYEVDGIYPNGRQICIKCHHEYKD